MRHRFDQPQIALAGQTLVGHGQRRIERLRLRAQQTAAEDAREVANPQPGLDDAIQENFHIPRVESGVDQRMKLRVTLLVPDCNRGLLEHCSLPLSQALSALPLFPDFGAGDGDRTRDQQLGRL